MKNILLIGSKGILGSYFSKKLKKNNFLHTADLNNVNYRSKTYNTYKIDISKESEVEILFKSIKSTHGKLDVLINAAAFTTEMMQKSKFKIKNKDFFNSEIWNLTINTNLNGVFYACKYFIKYHHTKKKDQRIISFSSIYGNFSPHHNIYKKEKFFSSISYTATKSGILGLNKWLSTKYAKEQSFFNTVSPGGVLNKHNNRFKKNYCNLVPINKMANPTQIYSVINFLISKDADYVVGENINVDGGFSAW
jgi:NAD(P)-dependent dehydrogenase (short-subunit alcohol dehydrogenase family)